jgi:hypothetical protein
MAWHVVGRDGSIAMLAIYGYSTQGCTWLATATTRPASWTALLHPAGAQVASSRVYYLHGYRPHRC